MKSYRKELWFETKQRREIRDITPVIEECLRESGVREGLCLVNAMHITSSVFINDAESGLYSDYEKWLEKLAPEKPYSQYAHNGFEDNADAHLKRTIMGREVVVAVTDGQLDFGPWERIHYPHNREDHRRVKTSEFQYELPPELIAQRPLPERSASRLMVVRRDSGEFEHRTMADIGEYLHRDDVLVLNNTRVIPARVIGAWDDTGGRVEFLLLEETATDEWLALQRTRRRIETGLRFSAVGVEDRLEGEILAIGEDGRVQVRLGGSGPVHELLEEVGEPPVPPYIGRKGESRELVALDRERYQTVYARQAGAVAAPTAGLHFDEALLARLEEEGVRRAEVTLHVGPGTFKPVKVDAVEDHVMESERYEVSGETAAIVNASRQAGGRVVAVGSTSVRTLESVASESGVVSAGSGRSSLFIYPPYRFRAVDAILTNFHLPCSTLLMMMSAFAGAGREKAGLAGRDLLLRAYREAVDRRYRFYSYGDAMLIV